VNYTRQNFALNREDIMAKDNRIKIFTIGDHPLSPSGVGTQTRYVVEALLETGNFKVVSFGGAIKHKDHTPQKTEQWEDDWIIYPVDGYGNQEMVRSILRTEKPDILWFMTDPRFYGWLWDIEHEIRSLVPIVYYHVWDNYPYPMFNKAYYSSNDVVATISKVTDDIVRTVAPTVQVEHVPHSVNTEIFKDMPPEDVATFKNQSLPETSHDKTIFFWNNRNARRKQSGSLVFWFKDFLDEIGDDSAMLIMHTDVKDPNGQDLEHIIQELGITKGQIMFSGQKLPPENMAAIYNIADCTINISDAEGFGLATLESLACGTPIIVNMTGGLQEQVTDGEEWFGIGIEPSSKAIIGSQEVPYIYEDRINKREFIEALKKMHHMSKEDRKELGKKGQAHVMKNYNFKTFKQQWVDLMTNLHEEHGSWDTRKNYKAWELREIS
jgi:glycosyltransferase involved in cell wall biosynthesis